jgi:hypothetical protein
LSSAALATGFVSIEPLDAVMMSTRHFRCAAFVGLAVLGDDLHGIGLAADLQPLLKIFPNVRQHPILSFSKARHRPRLRRDMADLDHFRRAQNRRPADRRDGSGRRAGLQYCATCWFGCSGSLKRCHSALLPG